jgi:hypothetical protein
MDDAICGKMDPRDCKRCISLAEHLRALDLDDEDRRALSAFFAHIENGLPITAVQKEMIGRLASVYLD